jgi:hypothetical protein
LPEGVAGEFRLFAKSGFPRIFSFPSPRLLFPGPGLYTDSIESVEDQINSRDEAAVEFEVFVTIEAFHDLYELLSFQHFDECRQKLILPGWGRGALHEYFFDFFFSLFVPTVSEKQVFLVKHRH